MDSLLFHLYVNISDELLDALNAINTQTIGSDMAAIFAGEHECGDGPDIATSTTMDIHNNSQGNLIGQNIPPPIITVPPSHFHLRDAVCIALEVGLLNVLGNPNDPANSAIIPSNEANCSCD